MSLSEKCNILLPERVQEELSRLRSLPALDRKLELVCKPIVVYSNDVCWRYIDMFEAPEGHQGKFATIISMDRKNTGILETSSIHGVWYWSVSTDGLNKVAEGHETDMEVSMNISVSTFKSYVEQYKS